MKTLSKSLFLIVTLSNLVLAEIQPVDGPPLDKVNTYIKSAKSPIVKQVLICERDANYVEKPSNAEVCIKAAEMIVDSIGKKLTNEEIFLLDKNDKNTLMKKASSYYHNAAIIFEKQKNFKNAFYMYIKAIELSNYARSYTNIGLYFASGVFVKKDDYLAYKYWKTAADLGNEDAKNNLNILCNENPKVCK